MNWFDTIFSYLGCVAVEIWVFLYVYPRSLKSHNGNHAISYNQKAFIFEGNVFLHLSSPIEQIYSHDKMCYVFNLGLTTPLDDSLPNDFSNIFKISLIFMNIQLR